MVSVFIYCFASVGLLTDKNLFSFLEPNIKNLHVFFIEIQYFKDKYLEFQCFLFKRNKLGK